MPNINEILSKLDTFGRSVRDWTKEMISDPNARYERDAAQKADDTKAYEELYGKPSVTSLVQKLVDDQPKSLSGVWESILDDFRKRSPLPYGGAVEALAPGGGGKGIPAMLSMINVWHGSPHLFRKFNLSKVGWGEGTFGDSYGFHFGDKKSSGEFYARNLAHPKIVDEKGETIPGLHKQGIKTENEKDVIDALAAELMDRSRLYTNQDDLYKRARESLQKELDHNRNLRLFPETISNLEKQLELLELWKSKGYKISNDQVLYNVNLKWKDPSKEKRMPLDKEHFLTYEAPMGEQAPNIARLFPGADLLGKHWFRTMRRDLGSRGAADLLELHGIPGTRYIDEFAINPELMPSPPYNYVITPEVVADIISTRIQPKR